MSDDEGSSSVRSPRTPRTPRTPGTNPLNPRFPPIHYLDATANHTHTCILLHGRGSNGPDFEEELLEGMSSRKLTLEEEIEERFPHWKWVFVSAPDRYSAAFQSKLEEWFDIYSLNDLHKHEDLQMDGLRESCVYIRDVILDELRYVPASRIVLGGISMGCATSVHALLAGSRRLGGYVGFCGWMPFRQKLEELQKREEAGAVTPQDLLDRLKKFYKKELSIDTIVVDDDTSIGNKSPPNPEEQQYRQPHQHRNTVADTPVFLSHNAGDTVIDPEYGRQMRSTLRSLGMRVQWREYDDEEHWIKEPDFYDDFIEFIDKIDKEVFVLPNKRRRRQSGSPDSLRPAMLTKRRTPEGYVVLEAGGQEIIAAPDDDEEEKALDERLMLAARSPPYSPPDRSGDLRGSKSPPYVSHHRYLGSSPEGAGIPPTDEDNFTDTTSEATPRPYPNRDDAHQSHQSPSATAAAAGPTTAAAAASSPTTVP